MKCHSTWNKWFGSVVSHFRRKRNNKKSLLRYRIICTKSLHNSTSPLNRLTVSFVYWKCTTLDHFTDLPDLTDLDHLGSFFSLPMWDLLLRQLTSESILTRPRSSHFTRDMPGHSWAVNKSMNPFPQRVSPSLFYMYVMRTDVWKLF